MQKTQLKPVQAKTQATTRQGGIAIASPQGAQLAQLEATINASPDITAQRKLQDMMDTSLRMVAQRKSFDGLFGTAQRVEDEEEQPLQLKSAEETPVQFEQQVAVKPNNTGLPDNLKSGIENLSGMAMDHVKVHYNSSQPAQLNALAYAQGSDIHVAPGQEKHLPHEAWHVVQQAQGRVRPTMQMKDGFPVNDEAGLEREADLMGEKAAIQLISKSIESGTTDSLKNRVQPKIQMKDRQNARSASGASGGSVIQMMRPDREGWYILNKGKFWYKGEPEVDGYFKFYLSPIKKMSQQYKEQDILAKDEEEGNKMVAPSSQGSVVGFSSEKDEVHTYEKLSDVDESDLLLSEKYPEQPGDFDDTYQTKIKNGNKYYERIQLLISRAKELLKKMPEGHVGLWRFHMNAEEYQSHAYQDASKKQEVVPTEVLYQAVDDLNGLASHMYESSKKHASPAVSFTRSIDCLIDASFHLGADAMLRSIIFGGKEVNAAKFLSFVAIPKTQLVLPENVPIPKTAERRDRKGEARARSMRELEALHIPLPDSGGKITDPLLTVENPFPESKQPELPDCSRLKTLDLSGVYMHWTNTSILVEAIENGQLPNLTKLVIKAESITPDLRGRAMTKGVEVEVI